ncbi:tetratricopeptide repeat protein [Olivibacter sp. CPCC 100613]|uniref:tetratricopeptide repeat protein n=1 Tax=Olivibacter sp. CPCC 100613 TaxID=3079931 RepID=UPI002FF62F42
MGLLQKIFGKKKQEAQHAIQEKTAAQPQEELIQAYDSYGRPVQVSKKEWKDKVLLPNLEKSKQDPNQLYNLLVEGFNDGFADELLPFALHLQQIDPNAERGSVMLAIAYLHTGQPAKAEEILQQYIKQYGATGIVLTNLAKAYDAQGKEELTESTLWQALAQDPNQDNGLGWYIARYRDRGGDAAALEAYRRVAQFPNSWRALLWVAQSMLQDQDVTAAKTVYEQAIERAGTPVPSDLLMQMSGDLGNTGYLKEIRTWVAPHFDATYHGLQVGNNLIKATLETGHAEEAKEIVNQLFEQQRPDWEETLRYWENAIAQANIEKQNSSTVGTPEIIGLEIKGPLWIYRHPAFEKLLTKRTGKEPRFAFIGGAVLYPEKITGNQSQLSDVAGRLSRSIPLLLAEATQLNNQAQSSTLIYYAQERGFTVFGQRLDAGSLAAIASQEEGPDYVFGLTLNTTPADQWMLELLLFQRTEKKQLQLFTEAIQANNPAPGVIRLRDQMLAYIASEGLASPIDAPDWYQLPADGNDYLLRLEQQLAVIAESHPTLKSGGLVGDREIVNGTLLLCLNAPKNPLPRILLAQTLHHMQQVHPATVEAYKDKIRQFEETHPLSGEEATIIHQDIRETLRS